MASSDFLVLPLNRQDGQDQPRLPGFFLAEAPRRAARGRKGDRLLLLLGLQGNLHISPSQQNKLLEELASGFFQSAGSATTALKEQAERLNTYLLERNHELAQQGQRAKGLLSILLIRENSFLLAQCGPVHAFLLNADGIQHYYDSQNAGRGLGLGQATDIRFYQIEIMSEDLFLVMPQLPSGWNEHTLQNVRGQKLATLRRRFLGNAGADLKAVMLAAKEGSGAIQVLSSSKDLDALEPVEVQGSQSAPKQDPFTDPAHTQSQASARTWESVNVPQDESQARELEGLPHAAEGKELAEEGKAGLAWLEIAKERFLNTAKKAFLVLQNRFARILPADGEFNLPSSTMALIAALVPVVVVILVAVLYLQVGRGQLYTNYLAQAQSAAAIAMAKEDPFEAREAWQLALQNAQKAESYESNDQSGALLLQARSALDDMDSIERLDFQLALFAALPADVSIKRMLSTNTELYLLDANEGKVLRAFLTGGGYQLDEDFICGPGPFGGYIVTAIVDIALLPRGNPQDAALAAMDANGNLIYCIVDERPLANPLEAPDSNWGNPIAISIADENLYVLDPLTNAVWLFFGEEFSFVEEPRFYFGADVPALGQAIDLDIQGDDLFILNVDGELARCQFSDDLENPTTCEHPAEFRDNRPGKENGPQIESAHFLQIQTTNPPEPSIYLLDPIAHSVYQFSLRLNLVRQYKPISELSEGIATAFAVSPNRAIFLAIENQLYIAFLP